MLAAEELTPFAFLDGPRTYSPVVSYLNVSPYPFISFNWRADYDPLQRRVVAQTYGTGLHLGKYFVSVSDNALNTMSVITSMMGLSLSLWRRVCDSKGSS